MCWATKYWQHLIAPHRCSLSGLWQSFNEKMGHLFVLDACCDSTDFWKNSPIFMKLLCQISSTFRWKLLNWNSFTCNISAEFDISSPFWQVILAWNKTSNKIQDGGLSVLVGDCFSYTYVCYHSLHCAAGNYELLFTETCTNLGHWCCVSLFNMNNAHRCL